jgi:hypothetical protein
LDFDEFNLDQAKWKTAPKMMIKKCAQSQALREAAGITGLQVEESFVINNGVATADKEVEVVDKEEERLLQLIAVSNTLHGLEQFRNHCFTEKSKEAFNNKMIELEGK